MMIFKGGILGSVHHFWGIPTLYCLIGSKNNGKVLLRLNVSVSTQSSTKL